MRKKWPLFMALFLLASAALVYSGYRVKVRVEQTLEALLPGATLSWGYVIPIPILKHVFGGDIVISREGDGPDGRDVHLRCKSLTVYRNSDTQAPGGTGPARSMNLTLEGLEGHIRTRRLSIEHIELDLIAARRERGGGPEAARRPRAVAAPVFSARAVSIRNSSGHELNASSINGKGFEFIPHRDASAQQAPGAQSWETLLRHNIRVEELHASGLMLKEGRFGSTLWADMTMNARSGPQGLHLAVKYTLRGNNEAAGEAAGPETVNGAKDEEAKPQGRRRLRDRLKAKAKDKLRETIPLLSGKAQLITDGSSLDLVLALPWSEDTEQSAGKAQTRAQVYLPRVISMSVEGQSPAPSLRDAAVWADSCLEMQPPFVSGQQGCFRQLAFEHIRLRMEDKGVAARMAMGLTGYQLLRGALEGRGTPGAHSGGAMGFLLICAAVLSEGDERLSLGAVSAVLRDREDLLYPFRRDFKDRLLSRKLIVDLEYEEPQGTGQGE
ncbi:hypothetical protein LJC59_08835 [Desulfovibrio sp. OttesenSCG-928-A18]|nr:hypothetical protein [Desulfovibrio sp. OttesenSCG-928-A18]